jgi:hypothetical protein
MRDLIIDGVGASGEHQFAVLLDVFEALGYEVRVLLVDAPTETAEQRNLRRAQVEGLMIDQQQLASLHREVSARFDEWKDLPAAFKMYATE